MLSVAVHVQEDRGWHEGSSSVTEVLVFDRGSEPGTVSVRQSDNQVPGILSLSLGVILHSLGIRALLYLWLLCGC